MSDTLSIPHFNYTGHDHGQVIENWKSFHDSLITDVTNEYWRLRVVNSLSEGKPFALPSHRWQFIKKHAQFASFLMLKNKKNQLPFRIRECGFGNAIFASRFLRELKSRLSKTTISWKEVVYELVDYPSVIEQVKHSRLLADFQDNIIYNPIDLTSGKIKNDADGYHLIYMSYLIDCLPTTILSLDEFYNLKLMQIRIVYAGENQLDSQTIKKVKKLLKDKNLAQIPRKVKEGLIAEIKEKDISLKDLDPEWQDFIKERIDLKQAGMYSFHEPGIEILKQQLKSLNKEGFVINNEFGNLYNKFGHTTIKSPHYDEFESVNYIDKYFKNSAYPMNFSYLKTKFKSHLVTDRKIMFWLISASNKNIQSVANEFEKIMVANEERKIEAVLKKVKHLSDFNKPIAKKILDDNLDRFFKHGDDQQLLEAAFAYVDLGEYDFALKCIEELIKRQPELPNQTVLFLKAQCHRMLSQMNESILAMRQLLNMPGEKGSEIYNEAGRINYALGNVNQALADFHKSLSKSPNWSSLLNIYTAYKQAGQEFTGAKILIGRMIELVKDYYMADPNLKNQIHQILYTQQDQINDLNLQLNQVRQRLDSLQNHLPPVRV